MSRIPKNLQLQYAGRPKWVAEDDRSDLRYLGWGVRDYARYPAASSPEQVWSYSLILRGSPILLLRDGPRRLEANQVAIVSMHGHAVGFREKPGKLTDILIWVWRSRPLVSSIRPALGGYRLVSVSAEASERLQAMHAACRREVVSPDEFTRQSLKLLHLQVDIELARESNRTDADSTARLRVEEAGRWLKKHLTEPNPIFLLCDYLQLSHSTLDRLFRDTLGESPSEYHHRLRMEEAARLLQDGKLSVKEVAYRLGYRHPNHFSRAFKAYQRTNARRR
jgi:AraC-like DNA-binding protein